MRGGTANCNVILSENIIGAPVVTEATCVIAMNLPSLDKFESHTKAGGRLLINSSLIDRTSKRSDVQVLEIPVNAIANAQGSLKVANVVMLGAYIALSHVVKKETVLGAIEDVLGKSKRHLLDINVNALEEGIKFAHIHLEKFFSTGIHRKNRSNGMQTEKIILEVPSQVLHVKHAVVKTGIVSWTLACLLMASRQ